MEMSTFKLAFQQAQAYYHRCNNNGEMADLPRQFIACDNSAALTLTCDCDWVLVSLQDF